MKCIFCQGSSTELLIRMRSQSKVSLLNAMKARKDEVYSLVLQDISVLDCIRSEHFKVMYHRSGYKSHTSKHNCSFFKTESITVESQQTSVHPLVPVLEIQHNVQVVNREVCFLCEKKNFRKDRKLHKIESSDRLNNLMESAVGQNDQKLIQIMDENAFTENVVYLSPCITKYLLRCTSLKSECMENEGSYSSENDTAFKSLISDIDEDLTIHKKRSL